MASFKTHINLGMFIAVFMVLVIIFLSITNDLVILFLAFVCAIIGSFLPDIDVDTGTPFRIIFNTLAALSTIIAFSWFFSAGLENLKYLILLPLLIFVFTRFVVGWIFKKFSAHRGIWHSTPMLLVVTLFSLKISDSFAISNLEKLFIAISTGMGYLGHLVLDEIYSLVNIGGNPFKVKKSLGSALELFSHSKFATFCTYLILIILIFLNMEFFKEIFAKF